MCLLQPDHSKSFSYAPVNNGIKLRKYNPTNDCLPKIIVNVTSLHKQEVDNSVSVSVACLKSTEY